MQFLHNVHCVIFNNIYNQHWNWYIFVYFNWYLKEDITHVKFGTYSQTKI